MLSLLYTPCIQIADSPYYKLLKLTFLRYCFCRWKGGTLQGELPRNWHGAQALVPPFTACRNHRVPSCHHHARDHICGWVLLVLPRGAPLEGGDASRKPHQTFFEPCKSLACINIEGRNPPKWLKFYRTTDCISNCCRVISHIDLRMDLLIASVSWISLTSL
jgi:hypothetical protein